MKTKYCLLLLFLASNVFSQSTDALKKATQKIYEANFMMDFGEIVSYSYPPMVTAIGKEAMLEKTEHHYENEEYRLRYQLQSVPFQFGPITQIGKKSFCVITIRIPKRYFFEAKLSAEKATEKKAMLQDMNGTKDVTFEPNRNSFNVKMIATYLAVFDENTNGEWKFFNFDLGEQEAAFQTLFDESTKKQLKL